MTNDLMMSIEAEAAVLGAILQSGGDGPDAAWWKVDGELTADDFARADHRRIFGAIARLAPVGLAHDALTVADRLDADGGTALDDAGGLAYLTDLSTNAPGANVEAYAAIIRKYAARRRVSATAGELAGAVREPDSDRSCSRRTSRPDSTRCRRNRGLMMGWCRHGPRT